jgi:hypothetical protein
MPCMGELRRWPTNMNSNIGLRVNPEVVRNRLPATYLPWRERKVHENVLIYVVS